MQPDAPPPPQSSPERTWAMLCHLSSFIGYIGLPLGTILGPLIVWLIKKDEFPLVDDQANRGEAYRYPLTIHFLK